MAEARQHGKRGTGARRPARGPVPSGDGREVGVVFVHAGRPYELLPIADWPLSAARGLAAGNLNALAPVLGGEDALERLIADGFTVGGLRELLERVAAEPADDGSALPVAEAAADIQAALAPLPHGYGDDPAPLLPILERLWDRALAYAGEHA
ncbi:MAG: hypothetical protein FWE15_27995 [Actinomycetia bacterium]|nr:hypothetical protein [Actinomycetes bacterium]